MKVCFDLMLGGVPSVTKKNGNSGSDEEEEKEE